MKRPILLAALLATSSAMVQPAQAETASGTMLRMFDISTPSAGKVNFIGTGTANFNQSIGTNNNFNVGSSTNLGVNASASSTEDYTAKGNADLQLAGTSRLQQTIGTATSAFNVSTAAESSSSAAHTSAFEVANGSEYGSSWSTDYSDSVKSKEGWEYKTGDAASLGAGWYSDAQDDGTLAEGETGFIAAATQSAADAAWETYSKEEWKAGWQSTYDSQYKNSYETAVTASNTASSTSEQGGQSQAGIISGVFSTTDYGSTTSTVNAAEVSNIESSAADAAAEHIIKTTTNGTDTYSIATETDSNGNTTQIGNYANQTMTQEEMATAYDKEYTKSFNAAYSSAAGMMRTSDSTVTVTGIGVIADVNASESSSFTASAELLTGAARDGNGNGNASSGANLATSSYANQSNSSTASAFMQAFSGGLPDSVGTTAIKSIEEVESGGTGTGVTGYKITTSLIEETTQPTVEYTVDGSGNLTVKN